MGGTKAKKTTSKTEAKLARRATTDTAKPRTEAAKKLAQQTLQIQQDRLTKKTVFSSTIDSSDNHLKRDPPPKGTTPNKPSIKEPSSPATKKRRGHDHKKPVPDEDIVMVDSKGNPIPVTPATDRTMAHVAKNGVEGLDPKGVGVPLAALFRDTKNTAPLKVDYISFVEGTITLPPKPAESEQSNLQHVRLALWDWFTSQQSDVSPSLTLLMLEQTNAAETDRIMHLRDIPNNLAGLRKIFGKSFRTTSKDGKVRLNMRLGSDEPLADVCADIRDNSSSSQIYPNRLNKPDTCQPMFLACTHRNIDTQLWANEMNRYFQLVSSGKVPLEHYVPAAGESPVEIALIWRTIYDGVSKEEKDKRKKKSDPIHAIHVICERKDRERAITLCTAFFNDDMFKSVNSLGTCVVPVWDGNASAAEKDKCREWIGIQKAVNNQIDFRNVPGAFIACDRFNEKEGTKATLRQYAMRMTRTKNADKKLFGDVNMTSQGTVLISFATKFKKEAVFRIMNLAGYLYHIYGDDGLFWFDENTKAKVKKNGWNEEEDRPNTESDDMYVSLEEKKGIIGQMFDLSALDELADSTTRPSRENIVDDVDTDADGFSTGGLSEAYDEQGRPKKANSQRFGGMQDGKADTASVISRTSTAYRAEIAKLKAGSRDYQDAFAKEQEARAKEREESRLAMEALQRQLEQTRTQNASDGASAPTAG
jgi:hypothetical protein